MDKIGGNKMRKALIITVGVGVGEDREKATDSLAHGIVFSIRNSNPTTICFVVTKESMEKTFPLIKNYMKELPEHDFILLDEKDKEDVERVYKKIREKIGTYQNEDYEVVIDFTSGTKAMSAGAVLAGTEKNCNIRYIIGERERGIVIKGTEKSFEISPIYFFINRQEELIKQLFNLYQFTSCGEIILGIKQKISKKEIVEKMEKYQKLANAYSMWDKFNHQKALEILQEVGREFDTGENKRFLNLLNKAERKEEFLIADLLNNAWRRMEEGRYDDAVARLYRCIEMVAQYRLKKEHGIDSSKIIFLDLRSKLPEDNKLIEKWRSKANGEGVIKLALQQDYELLKDLGDELGSGKENKELNNLLKKRNESILAHGVTPISREDTEKLYEKAVEIASKVVEKLDELRKMAEFPKL